MLRASQEAFKRTGDFHMYCLQLLRAGLGRISHPNLLTWSGYISHVAMLSIISSATRSCELC